MVPYRSNAPNSMVSHLKVYYSPQFRATEEIWEQILTQVKENKILDYFFSFPRLSWNKSGEVVFSILLFRCTFWPLHYLYKHKYLTRFLFYFRLINWSQLLSAKCRNPIQCFKNFLIYIDVVVNTLNIGCWIHLCWILLTFDVQAPALSKIQIVKYLCTSKQMYTYLHVFAFSKKPGLFYSSERLQQCHATFLTDIIKY